MSIEIELFALVVTGPPGAGKSAVLEALSDALVLDDIRHAMIETEALTSAHPALDDNQWFAPVAAVCGLYRDFGYERLLVAVTLESEDELRALVDAVGADEHVVVRLEAEPETLRRRIIEREPEGWSGLDELVAASARLSPVIAGFDGITLALSTEGRRPEAVAARIRDEFPGALRPARRRDTRERMTTRNDELVRSSFDAFLRGDWNALAQVMDPSVQWLWYEPGDADCHGRERVLATLFERQREGVVTGLNAVVAVDERVLVEITGPRLEQWGMPEGQACMVVTVRDGRIVRMQDYPSRATALAGAGLPPEPGTDAETERTFAGDPPRLRPDAPLARQITETIRTGAAAMLEQHLREHPALARARVADSSRRRSRTLLHLVTDWPGQVPEAAAKIQALVAAGADVNAQFAGPHSETPLHWAASSDDIEALDALLDAGADIEADGAVIGGGTPMADAVAFGQWAAARRLLERGARTTLWQAAALGLLDRVRDELAQTSPTRGDLDNALWCAAHGGQRATAELLLARGADPAWVGHDDLTAAGAAERGDAPQLAAWLREQAANRPPRP